MRVAILKTTHKGFSLTSLLIRLVQKTKFSHFAIEINDSIIHATGKSVRIYSFKDFFPRNIVVEYIPLEIDADFEGDVYPWMVSVSNRKYGFLQIVGLLLKQLKIVKRNPFGDDTRRIICNELVLLFLKEFKDVVLEKDTDDYDLNETSELIRRLKC